MFFKVRNLFFKYYALTLLVLSFIGCFLVFKTSSDIILPIFQDTLFELWLMRFYTGNNIISNISTGFIVSSIFYLLVVWLPYKRKRNLMVRHYEYHYFCFKRDIIFILLTTCNIPSSKELLGKLTIPSEFRRYFEEKINEDQCRWDIFITKFEESHEAILTEFELLGFHTRYILSNIDHIDEEVFASSCWLNIICYRITKSQKNYDDFKLVSQYMWEIFAGWSATDGWMESDVIQDMIRDM